MSSLLVLAFWNASEFLNEVKVPGTTRKPARIIHVKRLAAILCIRGISSRCNSISMYRVCTEGTLVRGGFDVKVLDRPKVKLLLVFFRCRDEVFFNFPATAPADLNGDLSSEWIVDSDGRSASWVSRVLSNMVSTTVLAANMI